MLGGSEIALENLGTFILSFGFGSRRLLPNPEWLVKGIPLYRSKPGFPNRFNHIRFGLQLRRSGAGHMENVFLENRSVKVVGAVAERHLGKLEPQSYPICGNMIEIVQIDP